MRFKFMYVFQSFVMEIKKGKQKVIKLFSMYKNNIKAKVVSG